MNQAMLCTRAIYMVAATCPHNQRERHADEASAISGNDDENPGVLLRGRRRWHAAHSLAYLGIAVNDVQYAA